TFDSTEPTSSSSMFQNVIESGTLMEITIHPPKRLKKNPFWNELTKIERWKEIMQAIKAKLNLTTERRNIFESKNTINPIRKSLKTWYEAGIIDCNE
ncbi:9972_t:CDS:2, partial [Ambispora leptoticha]